MDVRFSFLGAVCLFPLYFVLVLLTDLQTKDAKRKKIRVFSAAVVAQLAP